MWYKNIRQRIWAVLVISVTGFLVGVILLVGAITIRSEGPSFMTPLAGVAIMLSSVGVNVGIVLLKQQTRIDQIEEELARLKTTASPLQPQQP